MHYENDNKCILSGVLMHFCIYSNKNSSKPRIFGLQILLFASVAGNTVVLISSQNSQTSPVFRI